MSLFGIPSIAGTLQLHLARFVHVTAALDYYPPAATVPQWPSMDPYARDAYAELPPKYVLEQTRRMRTGELHYFDHPAFGLLVTVRPHEAPWGETGHE